MTYRIDSDDQDQEIRDLTNRVAELEKQLAEAQKPNASEKALPIRVVSNNEVSVCEHDGTFYQNIETDHVYCSRCNKDLGKQTDC